MDADRCPRSDGSSYRCAVALVPHALRGHDVRHRPSMDVVELARRGRGARLRLAVHAEHTHIPVEPTHAAAHRRRRAGRGVQAHARPVRRARGGRAATDASGSAPASRWSPSASRSSRPRPSPTLDQLSGGRFVFGIGFGWNEDELENHGVAMKRPPRRRPRARARDAGAVDRRRRRLPRRARQRRARLVVAQAGAAAASADADRRRGRARSCSPTSPSTPTAGSRSAAPASPRPCRDLRAVVEEAGRDPSTLGSCRSARSPTRASSTTSPRSVSTEFVLRIPSGSRATRYSPRSTSGPRLIGRPLTATAEAQRRSRMVTLAWPPPSHIVCRP